MSDDTPDELPSHPRTGFGPPREKPVASTERTLLARGLRALDARAGASANRVLRIGQARLSPSAKNGFRRALKAILRGSSKDFRNGRGAGVRTASKHAQRVIVKARVVPLRAKTPAQAIREHLTYMARDAASHDGHSGRLFNEAGELGRDAVTAFTERGLGCRHQFRFIVSPERGGDLHLDSFTRDLMRTMQGDLGTRLDYAAAVHYDTDQPHVHIVVNGRDERGGDLVMSRDYIGNGLRYRAMELATDALGYRSDHDILQSLTRDVQAERFTALDRRLQNLAQRDVNGVIDVALTPSNPRAALQRRLYLGRLAYLASNGLAQKVGDGQWRLESDALDRLRGLTQHREILRQVERHVTQADRVGSVVVIDKATLAAAVTGRVLGRGSANELNDTAYVVVAGTDGRTYYAALSHHSERHLEQGARSGDIVTLRRVESNASGHADRNVVALAERNGGVYAAALHVAAIGDASLPHNATPERYVEAHVLRLEGLASRGLVAREVDGCYRVPADLIERLERDSPLGRDNAFVRLDVRGRDLRTQSTALAFTWLDEQLVADVPRQLAHAAVRTRFQSDLIEAAETRGKRLVNLGLADIEGGAMRLDPSLKTKLDNMERTDATVRLSGQYGRPFDFAAERHFAGRVAAIERLESGPHAVVVAGNRFALVPAERGLSRQIGKDVSLTLDRAQRDANQARIRYRVLDSLDLSPSLGR